jgi:hypothetical protein
MTFTIIPLVYLFVANCQFEYEKWSVLIGCQWLQEILTLDNVNPKLQEKFSTFKLILVWHLESVRM